MMSAKRPRIGAGLAALLLTSCLSGAAFAAAPTGNPIADAFLAGLEARGFKDVTVESVTGDRDTAELKGIRAVEDRPAEPPAEAAKPDAAAPDAAKPDAATSDSGGDAGGDVGDATNESGGESATGQAAPAEPATPPAPVAPMVLTVNHLLIDNAGVDGGRIKAGVFNADGLSFVDDESKLTVGSLAASDIEIPSADSVKSGDDLNKAQALYKQVTISDVLATDKDGFAVPVKTITASTDDIVDGIPHSGAFTASGIVIDVNQVADQDFKKELLALGYNTLNLSVSAKGAWHPDKSSATIDQFEIDADGIGSLTLTSEIGGLSKDAVAALSDPAQSDKSDAVIQGLTLENMTITFKNQTLVQRLLEVQAKDAGVSPDAYASQLAAAMPMLLMPLKNPEFQNTTAAAISTFLKDPKTLTVTASPEQGLSVMEIFGAAMFGPEHLPQMLKASVAANR